jgi:hypothetical protein
VKPSQALKNRIREQSKPKEGERKPSLLDILRERNRELETREGRKALLRRIKR